MRRSLTLAFLVCLSHLVLAQKNYESGYYITQAGERVEGLIQNNAWRYSPDKILFKTSADSKPYELTPETAATVQIGDKVKFIGGSFQIDLSSDVMRKITNFQEARLEEKPLFLKAVLEGKGSLYEYTEESIRRYFFSVDNGPVQQLIYKAYVSQNVLQYNRLYKTQLWDNLKCESISLDQIQPLEYFKNDLSTIFKSYNQCQSAEITEYSEGKSPSEFHIWIRPGFQNSSLDLQQETTFGPRGFDANTHSGFRIGLLLEYKLPFRNGKFSVVAEPTFQSAEFSASRASNIGPAIWNAEIEYTAISMPIGIRFYPLNSEKSQLSVSAMFSLDLVDSSSPIDFNEPLPDVPISAQPALIAEVEYRYANRFSLGAQYGLNRDLVSDTDPNGTNNISAKLSYVSIFLGYKIF